MNQQHPLATTHRNSRGNILKSRNHKATISNRRQADLDKKRQREVNGNSIDYEPQQKIVPRYNKNRQQRDTALKTDKSYGHRLANAQEREYHLRQVETNNALKSMDSSLLDTVINPPVESPAPIQTPILAHQFFVDEDLALMNPIKRLIYSKLLGL